MASDKENMNGMQNQTKIPLPIDPLPPLPKTLLKRSISVSDYRHPLKTIDNQNINLTGSSGPSRRADKPLKTTKRTLCLDTRHVTVRRKTEELDWDYKVFKDEPEDSVIIISDDEDIEECKQNKTCAVDKERKKSCNEGKRILTPTLNSLEPHRIRNIKRSLKRPHSRELQGISSAGKKERRDDGKCTWRRHFSERLQDRLQSPDSIQRTVMKCLSREYTCDVFTYLLSVEVRHIVPHIRTVTRACLINWLIKINGPDGDPATVQTACWYLDAVLGMGYVQLEKLQVVAAACYWISQKIHGPSAQATRLVKYANRAFSAELLMAAEEEVLRKLKFPRKPVIPEDFISYLSWWCDSSHPGEIEVAATFICLAGMMVNRMLCEEYPSVVAAAAVKNALVLLNKWELLVRLQKFAFVMVALGENEVAATFICLAGMMVNRMLCDEYPSAAAVRNALVLMNKWELLARLQTFALFEEVEKKASNMAYVCSVQKKAVQMMVVPSYEYKAPFEIYGCGPHYIAQKIVKAAIEHSAKYARLQQGVNRKE